ncbi:MAG: SH3 domain-containing protein [Hyphomicrobiales bacterium]|nr:SH3 domain-containing protein [Hyphomicrobiales bacterium]
MALGLPKFRWLIIGAIAAGAWAMHEDMQGPRPPGRVQPAKSERKAHSTPKPSKPLTAKPAVASSDERPVPPKPVGGNAAALGASAKTALALPKTVEPPPVKPQKIVTGSIAKPDKPIFMQTKAQVHLRAQARPGAAVIATLEPRTVMRELARSGEWRLVMGDGRKGWVRADYLVAPTFLPRRPKLPVAEVGQTK